jgi:hypothetical protein
MTVYGDAAAFEAYFTSRGRTVSPTWDTADINAALLVASEWIDGIYGTTFVGYKTDGFTQDREWPRTNATIVENTRLYTFDTSSYMDGPSYTFAVDEIPTRVINATYEAAFRHLTTPWSLETDYTPGKYKSVSIDGALEVEFNQINSYTEIQLQIAAVDRLIWPLLEASLGGGMSSLSGGSSRV